MTDCFLVDSAVEKHNLNSKFMWPDGYRAAAITKYNWRQSLVAENRQ